MSFKLLLLLLLYLVVRVSSSVGDRHKFFQNCLEPCQFYNCTTDGVSFKDVENESTINSIFLWTCFDECRYQCMWRTTNQFIEHNWKVPQFNGKWPFKRILGVQEPASVVFSLLNFIANLRSIMKFRREVRRDSPLYYLWHFFAGITMNGWIWSTVFHTRDFPITELLDYTFAYSIVLATLFCTLIRIFHKKSIRLKVIIALVSLFYFLKHFTHLSKPPFDYGYNIKANLTTGMLSTVIWIIWYWVNRNKKPYALKILIFIVLTSLSLTLELMDFPPLFWTFDAHSLWHFSTIPLTYLFYSFVIDDCKYLRQVKYDDETEKKIF